MKKITLLLFLILAKVNMLGQVSFSGTLPYRTTPENSWEGIDVDINLGILGTTSAGGVSFRSVAYDKKVNSIKIRQREIPASQIPSNVLGKLKNDMRLSSVTFDLYVNSSFIKRMTDNTTIGWAELQGLANAEGYKQAVRDQGYKLFNNGALSIKNVEINVSYIMDRDYQAAIEKDITSGGMTAGTSKSRTSNDKVTELGLSMPSGSSSTNESTTTQTNSSIPSLESQYARLGIPVNTPTYTKQEITTQVVTQSAGLVGGLLNDWNASRDKRIATERATYEQQQSIEIRELLKKYKEKFIAEYFPLMDKAKSGDENARMTLYFASASLYSQEYVPQREQWFEEALKNNNTDAILEAARMAMKEGNPYTGFSYDFKKSIPYLERAVSSGSVDAMVILASWYNNVPTKSTYKGISYFSNGGQNPKLALELYKLAAEKGSPNAMYHLGMIHKYGKAYNQGKKDKPYEQCCIILNEKVSLDWFIKSLLPNYKESLYAKSSENISGYCSYFNPSSNSEISTIIYDKKGRIVPGYEKEAKEFQARRTNTTYEMKNKQKFKN